MSTLDPAAEKLRDLIPRGITPILDLFAMAGPQGFTEAEIMSALAQLRRAGAVSFDGRAVRCPPQKPLDARYGPGARPDLARDDQWFRARLSYP